MEPALELRHAGRTDLPAMVALLADDDLGAEREAADVEPYVAAFDAIEASPDHELLVGVLDGAVVACLQLTVLPCLTHGGRARAQIEGVRVASDQRGQGVGAALFRWAFARAEERGCGVVQLTTDKRRPDARRFYEALGFVASHEGLKRPL